MTNEVQVEPDATRTDDRSPRRAVMLLRGAAVVASVGGLSWMVAAVLGANRGLDLTDESFYLLSYRWWNDNYDNFTGAQYVYGPLFQLLGYDIAGLRVARLVMTVTSHLWFGWAFMAWLRTQRPKAPATRWWEIAGTATITACAGILYSWLPLSPGYNDLALTCGFVLAGGVLWIARANQADHPPAAWVPLGMGATAVVMALTKWSSAALVLFGVVVVLLVLHWATRQSWLRLGRLAGFGILGMIATAAFIQFALVPWKTIVPPMLHVNSQVADSSNSPAQLLTIYRLGAQVLLNDVLAQHWPLLVAALVAPLLARWPRTACTLVVLALASSIVQVARHHGTLAGSPNLPRFAVTIFAPLCAILLVSVVGLAVATVGRLRGHGPSAPFRGPGVARHTVLAMLTILPVAVSFGTGNQLQVMAVLGLAAWVAVAIAILSSDVARGRATRLLIVGSVAGIVAATSLIAVDGIWNRPYRTSGYAASTAHAEDVPALDSLRFTPATAQAYSDLRQRLLPYVDEPGRAIMGFDAIAGLVYLLDGRSVGESWYGHDSARSTAGIIRTCDRDRWWGRKQPLVLFNRPVTNVERKALSHCGIRLSSYTTFTDERLGIVVYAPPRAD